jgi:hypothetical protein
MTKAIAALRQAREALDEAIATLEALAREPETDSAKVVEILRALRPDSPARQRQH